jgi:hypothetical protein
MPKPGHADALADVEALYRRADFDHMTYDLMAWDDRIVGRDFTIGDM